jgi:hypothetical protein
LSGRLGEVHVAEVPQRRPRDGMAGSPLRLCMNGSMPGNTCGNVGGAGSATGNVVTEGIIP